MATATQKNSLRMVKSNFSIPCYIGRNCAVTAFLKSGWLSLGPKTLEFEARLAHFLGVKHPLVVTTGTAALHLACEAVGLSPGGEVLCPALTFVASAKAVLYAEARPVFVDVAGTLNDIGFFSLFSNKNMTTGEGGTVVTDDDELAGKIKTVRSHGMTTPTWDRHRDHSFSYDVVAWGYNYRLDEMRAALGLVQLNHLETGNTRRRVFTDAYRTQLKDLDHLEVPFSDAPVRER
jgi:dTDP-4-amino-4,6-dideoxygalactose transaminase